MADNTKNIFDELKEFYEKILPILKLTSLVASAFSIIISFMFAMTYMRDNGFFSYEIFSINFMWIFLLMGILFVIIRGLYIFGAYLRITPNYQRTKNQIITTSTISNRCAYIVCIDINIFLIVSLFLACCYILYNNNIFIYFINIYFIVLLITLFIACVLYVYRKDYNIRIIAVFIEIVYIVAPFIILYFKELQGLNFSFKVFVLHFFLFEVLIVVISCVAKDIKKWFKAFSVMFIIMSYILFLLVILYPELLRDIFKKALKSISLASDHAEIYLKDKNESVISGKLIFDDGKYAYVEFDRTVSNCNDVGDSCIKTIRRKVPSEDVSIVTKVKKDTKASVPK